MDRFLATPTHCLPGCNLEPRCTKNERKLNEVPIATCSSGSSWPQLTYYLFVLTFHPTKTTVALVAIGCTDFRLGQHKGGLRSKKLNTNQTTQEFEINVLIWPAVISLMQILVEIYMFQYLHCLRKQILHYFWSLHEFSNLKLWQPNMIYIKYVIYIGWVFTWSLFTWYLLLYIKSQFYIKQFYI